MHIIANKTIKDFIKRHPDAKTSLTAWYKIFRKVDFTSLTEIRYFFPSVDYVGGKYVFNISGNKYRLVAAIHLNRKKCFILAILTHTEYDRDRWKR